MGWREAVKLQIPPYVLNSLLLACPSFYRLSFVNYESQLDKAQLKELLSQLDSVKNLDGNIIECGSSRCGTSIILSNWLRREGLRKLIYACDTFAGFDREELRRERKAGVTNAPDDAFTSTSYECVVRKIKTLGLQDVVLPIKGLFRDTLPHLNSKWCVAFLDCDLEASTLYCADTIWEDLASQGRIVFHDYDSEYF